MDEFKKCNRFVDHYILNCSTMQDNLEDIIKILYPSKAYLAEKMGVSKQTISNYCKKGSHFNVIALSYEIITTVLGIAGSIAGIFVAANLSEENVFSREAWSFVQKPRN